MYVCVALEGVFNVSEEAFCRGVPALMNEGRDPNMTSIVSHAPHYSASNELRILSPTLAELHPPTQSPTVHRQKKNCSVTYICVGIHTCMICVVSKNK